MTADRKAPPERQAAEEAPRARPLSFGELARRISAWTSRALVSAIILVAGLAFGRQVLHWWAAGEGERPTGATGLTVAGGLGDPHVEHTLQFGGQSSSTSWSMSRSTTVADASGVLSVLRAKCREALPAASTPAGAAGPAEKGLLDRVRREKPAAEDPATGSRIYELDAAYPMVIGVRTSRVTKGDSPEFCGVLPQESGQSPSPSDHLSDRVADPLGRVVTWGIGVPAGPDSWTLYVFHSAPRKDGAGSGPSANPIPPGSRLWLGMEAAGGGSIHAFTGTDQPAAWKRFFDSWFAAHGWRVEGAWQERDSIWAAHCVGTTPETAGFLDVEFGRNGRGELTGLVLVTPSSGQSIESEKR
jgi:hypothetical protein